ncbi:hypothetical protein KR009_012197, partial [Drosophila setifemur]
TMFEIFNVTLLQQADPVTMPLMSTHWPAVIALSVYLLFVLKLGRKFMENRKAYDLNGFIKVYNIVQIIYNGLLLLYSLHFMFVLKPYDLRCVQRLPLDHEHKARERWLSYLYLVNKYMDLVETIIFVLRKKFRQISFLHVFHHVIMATLGYLYAVIGGWGGYVVPMCVLNVGVHVLMYVYYFMSSISTDVKASLWWKKYLTIVQLVQFSIAMVQQVYALTNKECNVNRPLVYLLTVLDLAFIVLFSNFYVRAYILPNRKKAQ